MKGALFDVQRFSVHDGPGIRSTVFMKGCPLRCAWCQNPEGLDRNIRVWNFDNLCIGCGDCLAACPVGALAAGKDGRPGINHDKCQRCGVCVDTCVRNAMAMDGFEIEAADLTDRLLNDVVFYDTSGGGVTFSGGEPLGQTAFVVEVAAALKAREIHTAVETSLEGCREDISAFLDCIDFFQVDIKILDSSRHHNVAGRDNFRILENFHFLARKLKGSDRLLVRLPLIPGHTADAANIEAVARFVGEAAPGIPLELMNYNPLASAKYRRMGVRYRLAESVNAFSKAEMAEMRALVAKYLPRATFKHT